MKNILNTEWKDLKTKLWENHQIKLIENNGVINLSLHREGWSSDIFEEGHYIATYKDTLSESNVLMHTHDKQILFNYQNSIVNQKIVQIFLTQFYDNHNLWKKMLESFRNIKNEKMCLPDSYTVLSDNDDYIYVESLRVLLSSFIGIKENLKNSIIEDIKENNDAQKYEKIVLLKVFLRDYIDLSFDDKELESSIHIYLDNLTNILKNNKEGASESSISSTLFLLNISRKEADFAEYFKNDNVTKKILEIGEISPLHDKVMKSLFSNLYKRNENPLINFIFRNEIKSEDNNIATQYKIMLDWNEFKKLIKNQDMIFIEENIKMTKDTYVFLSNNESKSMRENNFLFTLGFLLDESVKNVEANSKIYLEEKNGSYSEFKSFNDWSYNEKVFSCSSTKFNICFWVVLDKKIENHFELNQKILKRMKLIEDVLQDGNIKERLSNFENFSKILEQKKIESETDFTIIRKTKIHKF